MITELEKQFYKTFEIEPFCDLPCNKRGVECTDNTYCGNKYPEITAEKLLEMICLIADICNYSGDVFDIEQNSINELKKFILHFLINYMKTKHTDTFYKNDEVKICIQQLFKEEE